MPGSKGNKNALGNHGGRPSAYKPEYCTMILEYYQNIPDDKFPTMAGFASQIGETKDQLCKWCDQHIEFFNAYMRAKEFQEQLIIERTLTGKYNPQFSIFASKNILGWRDKHEMEHSGSVGLGDAMSEAEARLKAAKEKIKATTS